MGISRWNLVSILIVAVIKLNLKLEMWFHKCSVSKWKVIADYRLYTSEQSRSSIYPRDLD